MGVVFAKTRKGQDELTSKAGGLSPRVRRVLIFADGKRTIEEMRELVRSDDLQHTLGMLEEEGYIELASTATSHATQVEAPLPSVTAFRELQATPDPIKFQQARNFMLNTLTTFVGSLGATSLIERIERAQNHAGLRELFNEWYYAIVMTRDGRREAESLRSKLLLVI